MAGGFAEAWGFPAAVRAELGADSFTIGPTGQSFKSGRPKFVAVFSLDSGEEVRRDAMQLTAKRTGLPYFVVARAAPKPAKAPGGMRTLDEFLGAE